MSSKSDNITIQILKANTANKQDKTDLNMTNSQIIVQSEDKLKFPLRENKTKVLII